MTDCFSHYRVCSLLTASFAPVFGDQDCKPVVGHFEAPGGAPWPGTCPSDPTSFVLLAAFGVGFKANYQFVMTTAFSSVLMWRRPFDSLFYGKEHDIFESDISLLGTDTGSIDLPPVRAGSRH